MKIFIQKWVFLQITPHVDNHVKIAPLKSFLNRFSRIIACWKGIEIRNLDSLLVITKCKALHVIAYKMRNIVQKSPEFLLKYCKNYGHIYIIWKRKVSRIQLRHPQHKDFKVFRENWKRPKFLISPPGMGQGQIPYTKKFVSMPHIKYQNFAYISQLAKVMIKS